MTISRDLRSILCTYNPPSMKMRWQCFNNSFLHPRVEAIQNFNRKALVLHTLLCIVYRAAGGKKMIK